MSEATPAEILAVDDNPANLQSLRALLRDLPAEVVVATCGDDALRHLLRREFALILLDIQMPGLDGYQTAKLIRSRDRTRDVPIIFLTALDHAEVNVVRGYALGAVDFLFKPIVPEILRSKVAVFLELYRKRKEVERNQALLREAERRDAERRLEEARGQYERTLMREEMERERKVAEQRERAEKRLGVLADAASRLLLSQDDPPSGVYRMVADHLGLEVHVEYRLRGGKTLELCSHSGLPEEAVAKVRRLEIGDGTLSGRAAAEMQKVIAEDVPGAAGGIAEAAGLGAFAAYPLVAHCQLLGTVGFGSPKPRAFSADDVALMQIVCDQVAVSLERDRLIEELRERDHRKDEFLAMLAHELRNPMAPIRSAVDVLRLASPEDPKVCRAIESADRQIGHMSRLVDDLLDVSRITRGKVELRKSRVALSSVVEQAVQGTEPAIRERCHALAVSLPEERVELWVDATRITQVLANLLHNAAKYTDPGGRIALRAAVEGAEVAISVEDTGIGISSEMLPKIFEIFVQVEPTSDRAQGGLGLGLTLVKTLVEMHGGRVEAHSAGRGKGSRFVVRLPLAAPPELAPAAPQDAAPAPKEVRPLNILLIEDNEDIRTTMRDLLELHGHTVEEADDGEKGVELALRDRPNVALVDIGLPGLDGFGVAEKIRAAGDSLRLVALTGYGNANVTRRALSAGFDAHLVKPVSFADLSRVLAQLC